VKEKQGGLARGGNNNSGGGRGRGGGRSRRDEERDRNLETFGEPGGVGMMGPGAYVGGYGGYRGKRRRGGPGARGSRGGAPKAIAVRVFSTSGNHVSSDKLEAAQWINPHSVGLEDG
ncbi:4705_t:CDS:1, partial [Acaulospora colombiana]